MQDDPVTSGLRIANACWAALEGRSTAYRGRTVGDFLRALRELNIRDDDELSSIEIGIDQGTGLIEARVCGRRGGLEIREVAK